MAPQKPSPTEEQAEAEESQQDPRVKAAHAAYRAGDAPPVDAPAEQAPAEPPAAEEAEPDAKMDEEAYEEQEEKASPMQDALESFKHLGGGGRLKEMEEENAKLKDQLMRAVAETDNIRKRSEREKADLGKYAIAGFARDLVGVSENLIRAMESVPEEQRQAEGVLGTLYQGVDMTLNELLKYFEQHGVQRIDPLGEPFDHNFHQAVAQVESDEHAPGTVVQVVQSGYVLQDRLLRPAMVCVAKAVVGEDER